METLNDTLAALRWLKSLGLNLDEVKFLVSPDASILIGLEVPELTEFVQHQDEQVCPKPAEMPSRTS